MTTKETYLKHIYTVANTLDSMNSKDLSNVLKLYYKGIAYNFNMVANDIRRECGIILLAINSNRVDELRDVNILRMCELVDLSHPSNI